MYWQNHGAMTRQMASATITQNSMGLNASDREIANNNATNGDDVHQLPEIPVVTQVPRETENSTVLSQNKKNRPKRSSAVAAHAEATQVLEENDLEFDTEV